MANPSQDVPGMPYKQLKTPQVGVNRTTWYNLVRAGGATAIALSHVRLDATGNYRLTTLQLKLIDEVDAV